MANANQPIVAIVGSTTTSNDSAAAAEEIGRALAKGGFRIVVYGSDPAYLEAAVVRGYAGAQAGQTGSIRVTYPLTEGKPEFPEQQAHGVLFDWEPEPSPNWEMSFYRSLHEVDGIVLVGGGNSTLIAGIVAMGRRIAILAAAGFGGSTVRIWETLRPGRDLSSHEEIALMGRSIVSPETAAAFVATLSSQLARRADELKQKQLEILREEATVKQHALVAVGLFLAAVACVPIALSQTLSQGTAISLLFLCPLLAGVAGSTIRLVFDLRQGTTPLSRQSAITTGALGLIAGGIAGLLFVTAQMTAVPESVLTPQVAGRLVPFGIAVGFIAGLTLDAVFRKLITSDVVDVSAIEAKRRTS
jgi:hypothetical protein